jgi:hypothetical protein
MLTQEYFMKTLIPHNTRQNPVSMAPMMRLAAEVKEQMELLHQAPELRYSTFEYTPKVPALLRAPEIPFPECNARWYSNGRWSFGAPATQVRVLPRRGRRVSYDSPSAQLAALMRHHLSVCGPIGCEAAGCEAAGTA